MYDQLRNEYESIKRSATLSSKSYPRPEPDFFSGINMMDSRDMLRQGILAELKSFCYFLLLALYLNLMT